MTTIFLGRENPLQIIQHAHSFTAICNSHRQRGTGVKRLFWPPQEPKTENWFSQITFDWFIRRITEV